MAPLPPHTRWLALMFSMALAAPLRAQSVRDSSRLARPDTGAPRRATVVRGAVLDAAPAFTLEQALQGKLAGLLVDMNDGAPWSDGQLRIRGVNTLVGDPSPLVVVDGIIATNSLAIDPGNGVGSAPATSSARLREFTAFDIDRVEVLKGPVATARYGARGANGVLLITTRRAIDTGVRWRASQRTGQLAPTRLGSPRCLGSVATAKAEFPRFASRVDAVAAANGGRLPCFTHEQDVLGNAGIGTQSSIESSLRFRATGAVVSVSQLTADGPAIASGVTRRNVHLNLEQRIGSRVSARVVAGVSSHVTRTGLATGALRGALSQAPSWLELSDPALVDTVVRFRWVPNDRQRFDDGRVTGAVSLQYTALRSGRRELILDVQSGLDQATSHLIDEIPPTLPFSALPMEQQLRRTSNLENHVVALTASEHLGGKDRVAVRLAGALDRQAATSRAAFVEGGQTLETQEVVLHTSNRSLLVDATGVFMDERLTVNGVLRRDRITSSIGGNLPAIGATYQLLPARGGATLSLHGAWGRSGGLPSAVLSDFSFVPVNTAVPASSSRLERRSEFEVGVDAATAGGRVTATLGAFTATTDGAYVPAFVASVAGPVSVYAQLVSLHTRGGELTLHTVNVRRRNFNWDTRLLITRARSRVAGEYASTLAPMPNTAYPLGNSHRLVPNGSALAISTPYAVGDGTATFDATLTNRLRLGRVQLSVQLDGRAGGDIYDSRLALNDRFRTSADYDAPSPSAGVTLGAYRSEQAGFSDSTGVYLAPASALRVREAVLRYEFGAAASARRLAVSLQARNLALWARSNVTDPEFSSLGTQPAARYVANASYPLVRQLFAGIDVAF